MSDQRQPDERWPHFSQPFQMLLGHMDATIKAADHMHKELGHNPSAEKIKMAQMLMVAMNFVVTPPCLSRVFDYARAQNGQ